MIEDKLTKDERIRLEALNQANLSRVIQQDETSMETLNRAKEYEKYIRDL